MTSRDDSGLLERLVSKLLLDIGLRFLLLAPVFPVVIGSWLIWGAYIAPSLKSNAASDWVETPCVIEEIKIHSSSGAKTTTETYYDVRVVYRYEMEHQVYRSRQFDFYFGCFREFQEADENYVAQHPVGSQVVCYVDPNDPQSAVMLIDRKLGGGMALLATIFFVVSIVLGKAMYGSKHPLSMENKAKGDKAIPENATQWRANMEEERLKREARQRAEKESRARDRSQVPKRRKRKHRDKK